MIEAESHSDYNFSISPSSIMNGLPANPSICRTQNPGLLSTKFNPWFEASLISENSLLYQDSAEILSRFLMKPIHGRTQPTFPELDFPWKHPKVSWAFPLGRAHDRSRPKTVNLGPNISPLTSLFSPLRTLHHYFQLYFHLNRHPYHYCHHYQTQIFYFFLFFFTFGTGPIFHVFIL